MSERIDENDEVTGPTSDELIASAAAHGYTVSKRQLAEWHRAGLLPLPKQEHGDRAGSTSVYPPGTTERLLTLCACRQRHRHNMSDVAWCMWWQGWAVPMHVVRGMLSQVAARWSKGIREITADAPSGVADTSATPKLSRLAKTIIRKADKVRIADRVMLGARKRTGSGSFPTFVRVLLEVGVGAFAGFDAAASPQTAAEDRAIVEKGLGFKRARKDRLSDAGPWLTGDTGEVLQQLGSMVGQYPPGHDLDTLDDNELARTRDEIRTFLSFMDSYAAFLERAFGRGAFGLTVLGWMIRRLRPSDQGFLLLAWRSCRASGLGTNIDQMLATARQWHTMMVPMMRALEELRAEVPATAEILSPQQTGKAVRNKRVMHQTIRAIRALRDEHAAEMDAFFANRPEFRQAMDDYEAEQHKPNADTLNTSE